MNNECYFYSLMTPFFGLYFFGSYPCYARSDLQFRVTNAGLLWTMERHHQNVFISRRLKLARL